MPLIQECCCCCYSFTSKRSLSQDVRLHCSFEIFQYHNSRRHYFDGCWLRPHVNTGLNRCCLLPLTYINTRTSRLANNCLFLVRGCLPFLVPLLQKFDSSILVEQFFYSVNLPFVAAVVSDSAEFRWRIGLIRLHRCTIYALNAFHSVLSAC